MSGILYIVATPIGNLQDFTPRAITTLQEVDYILCEDTRHSISLLRNYSITTETRAFHDHNEREATARVIRDLEEGKNIALISDAGTPLISDPGYFLTQECHKHNIVVRPVPGCSAVITALCASGLASDQFVFYGFLPAKSKARKEKFASILHTEFTSIFYESTHRVVDSIQDLISELGAQRRVCLARELTKQFETIVQAPAQQILAYLEANHNHQKGEFVLIIDKSEVKAPIISEEILLLAKNLKEELPAKKVAKILSASLGVDKSEIYDYLVSLKQD